MNNSQNAFAINLAVVVALLLAGSVLACFANSCISGMEATADMNTFSLFSLTDGLLFVAAFIMSVVTLRLGGGHEVDILAHGLFSLMLTLYRELFWRAIAVTLLVVVLVVWLGLNIGPVR